jgi:serine/threonine protein kinase
MSLEAGTKLGRYEIRSKIGEGGMGEVYRAYDPKISREVAVKVLPAAFSADKERLARFEQEAQAAGALNHPNILSIFDVDIHDGAPYVVSELLEGETMRERLGGVALSQRKAIDYALQMVHGLAAAHERGIVHRDLKPENIFVTRDGRVKILDFGLAKLAETPAIAGRSSSDVATRKVKTDPGAVIGTVGYMSPEQLRTSAVDQRSDVFSFGAILYEMLSGKRAFQRQSAADTISAILKEDPPELSTTNSQIAPGLERIVGHCLEKNPEERFQSTRDLAFALESLSTTSHPDLSTVPNIELTTAPNVSVTPAHAGVWKIVAIGAMAVAIALAAIALFLVKRTTATVPSYHKLTFRRGTIWNARFAPDGQTVVYSATWNGEPIDIFTTRAGSTESRSLNLQNADVLAVSSSGELAVLLNRQYQYHNIARGILARVPLTGGAPREILQDVQQADWSPDGTQLAVVRWVDGRNRLEYPIGKVLYETSGYISHPRVSPKGDKVAFMDHQIAGDNRGWVAVVDANGKKRTLSSEWASEEGVAWTPSGDEIWFAATKGSDYSLSAVTLSGQERAVEREASSNWIWDISRDGHTLVSRVGFEVNIIGLAPGETKERDLSWLDNVGLFDLSADGKTVLYNYFGEGSGTNYLAYLRKTDGSPPVRLGEGGAQALSPDGKNVLSILSQPPQMILLPAGAGEVKRLERAGIEYYEWANWLPDGKHVIFIGRESGHNLRFYLQDVDGGSPRAVTPEGVGKIGYLIPVSPDGKSFIARSADKTVIFSTEGGEPRAIPGLTGADEVRRWTADGHSLFVQQNTVPLKVFRLDLATGRRELWKEITPTDPAGILSINLLPTPDGRGYVYTIDRDLHDLYVAEGLK